MAEITQVGTIRLQSEDAVNVFFAGEILVDGCIPPFENLIGIPHYTFGDGEFWIAGKHHEWYPVHVEGKGAMISGIYEDTINKVKDEDKTYKVKIYIEYEQL